MSQYGIVSCIRHQKKRILFIQIKLYVFPIKPKRRLTGKGEINMTMALAKSEC